MFGQYLSSREKHDHEWLAKGVMMERRDAAEKTHRTLRYCMTPFSSGVSIHVTGGYLFAW